MKMINDNYLLKMYNLMYSWSIANPVSFSNDNTTRSLWYNLAMSHDFEIQNFMTTKKLYNLIFKSHFYQLSLINLWSSSFCFHISLQSNFNMWMKNPMHEIPIAHYIRDPQFSESLLSIYSKTSSITLTSSLYHWFYTISFRSDLSILQASMNLLLFTSLLFIAAWFHQYWKTTKNWFNNIESFLIHHFTLFTSLSSILWTSHLIHVALPNARSHYINWSNFLMGSVYPKSLFSFFNFMWSDYAKNPDTLNHMFSLNDSSTSTALLTWNGLINSISFQLPLTDIAHHHLALSVILLLYSNMVSVFKKSPQANNLFFKSLHYQLALLLIFLSVSSSLFAHHLYAFPVFAYLMYDHTSLTCLFVHHQYIASFIMCSAFSHSTIYLIRDYNLNQMNWPVKFLLKKRYLFLNYLSYVSLFLSFHTLSLYVHNDFMQALSMAEKQICLFPIFAHWIEYVQSSQISLAISASDLLVHHSIALSLHVTTLILLKSALTSRSSKLMPDKLIFSYVFPCDSPSRSGTCDISSWDSFYLALFWMLNTISWTTFYWHWKNLTLWTSNSNLFNDSSLYLMSWFRDYLWLNSTQLINSYNPFSTNSLSVWAWMFLFSHLIWAISFMFLISWRSYWQELIETLVWAHMHTPIAMFLSWKNKPVALSIVQARLVSVVHFSASYILTYAPFVIASTTSLS